MADYSALPLFTDAYMRDCWHLSDAEHGRYLLLLILIWQSPECRIPNEPEWIARKMRRSAEEYETQIAPLIKEFCSSTGNWISQKRLTKEFAYVKKRINQRSGAANSRWSKENTDAGAYTEPMREPAAPHMREASGRNAPSPSPSPSKKESCPKPANGVSHETDSELFQKPASEPDPERKQPHKRSAYPEDFEAFWKNYPTDPGMSKREAATQWEKLTADDRRSAIDAIPGFRKWVSKQGDSYRVLHAVRYLSQRRFDGFTATKPNGRGEWERIARAMHSPHNWSQDEFGDVPGKPTCRMPEDLQKTVLERWGAQ